MQTQNIYSGLAQPDLYPLSSNSNQDEGSTNPRLLKLKPLNSLYLDSRFQWTFHKLNALKIFS